MSKKKSQTSHDDMNEELDKLHAKGQEIASKGREIQKAGQYLMDLSDVTKPVINLLTPNSSWAPAHANLVMLNKNADWYLDDLGKVATAVISSSSSTGTVTVSGVIADSKIIPEFLSPNTRMVQPVFNNFQNFLERSNQLEDLKTVMIEFGLDQAPRGRKSPYELLVTAHMAFENPVADTNPVTTSLIPLRECINSTVAKLLQFRPTQEDTKKKGKIVSIGNQLIRDGMDPQIIQTWSNQYSEIIKDLSGAKQMDYSRTEWSQQLNRGTLFLYGLLQGLDPTKLKN